jgi:[FeFe] hydrogenase H-cluster maturation GTPase HydF
MTKGKENKPHIGIFGRRNFGKSSLINAITGQDTAIVSEVPGTTTDPVKKSIEIPGIGPVVLIDTAGIDDEGDLGEMRVKKSLQAIHSIDLAILLVCDNHLGAEETKLLDEFYNFGVPVVFVHNKSDLVPLEDGFRDIVNKKYTSPIVDFSAIYPKNKEELVRALVDSMPESAYKSASLLGDLVSYGDIVLLIVPIDVEAPEGRLILPQVQTIRDILDNECVAIVLKEREVDAFLKKTAIRPSLVITDSSVFLKADAAIPKDIPLTGFSVLLARHKGAFDKYLEGTPKISELNNGDRILLLESCTHHVACDDIGRVKIPRWIDSYTGKNLEYDIVSGLNKLDRPITDYALVIQCGGCMITQKQIINRLKPAIDAGIPVTNYGMAIAWVKGIYPRAIAPFVKNVGSDDLL